MNGNNNINTINEAAASLANLASKQDQIPPSPAAEEYDFDQVVNRVLTSLDNINTVISGESTDTVEVVWSLVATVTLDVTTFHRHTAMLEGRLLEARRVYERSVAQHTIWVPSAPQGHRLVATNAKDDGGSGNPAKVTGPVTLPTPPATVGQELNDFGTVGTPHGVNTGNANSTITRGTDAEVPQGEQEIDTCISSGVNNLNGHNNYKDNEDDQESATSSDSDGSSASVVSVRTDPGTQTNRILPGITGGKHLRYQEANYHKK